MKLFWAVKCKPFILFVCIISLFSCKSGHKAWLGKQQEHFAHLSPAKPNQDHARVVETIAFGSCGHQDKSQPLLDSACGLNPDLFIYLGDNIYGDTRDMEILRAKYQVLANKPEFQRLWSSTRVLATWDDHDYGENDAGKYYPFKEKSKDIFLEFWDEAALSARRLHPGIFHAEEFGPQAYRVQVILLDTRTFRSNLRRESGITIVNKYVPEPSPDSTMLGEMQWRWLEDQFKKPAKLRIVASSNQFSHSDNGFESWTNLPRERERMLGLIRNTRAEGVLFISGDVHYGELSVIRSDSLYPIYDLTSSGITQTWLKNEANTNRLGEAVPDNNFGLIRIDWGLRSLELQLKDVLGQTRVRQEIPLDSLRF